MENFRSINEKVSLSLLASNRIKKKDDHTIIETLKNDKLLRSSIIYGPNASGKTNIIYSLMVLKHLVINSHQFKVDENISLITPFKFNDNNSKEPTKYSIIFIHDDVRYSYFLSLKSNQVMEEKLYYYPKGRKRTLFEREMDNIIDSNIPKKDKTTIKNIMEKTRPNVLLLSSLAQWNYHDAIVAYNWFKNSLRDIGANDVLGILDFTASSMMNDESFRNKVTKLINIADFGISNIHAEIQKYEKSTIPQNLSKDIEKTLNTNSLDEIEVTHREITFDHRYKNENGIENDYSLNFFTEESHGTQRFFSLLGPWISALENGYVLLVDELDIKIHHLLSKFLVELFNNPKYNKKNAQLIVTTHDLNLLDQKIFRRDQIWFTEKRDTDGSTDLFSLLEYNQRFDKILLKAYLDGRYGAIPYIDYLNEVF